MPASVAIARRRFPMDDKPRIAPTVDAKAMTGFALFHIKGKQFLSADEKDKDRFQIHQKVETLE